MKNRKCWVSLVAAILTVVMLLTLIVGILPHDASAETSGELKEQLDALQADKDALLEQINALEKQRSENLYDMEGIIDQKNVIDQQVALLYAEVANVNSQIQTYNLLIADKQEELELAQSRLAELNAKNKERIRAMEEEGDLSYWSVLFKANSFSDLLDRMDMMNEIASADRRRLEEMSEAAEVVAQAQAELTAEKAELEKTRADLRETEEELNEKSAESDKLLMDLVEVSEDLEAMYDQFEKEEEDFLDAIAKKEKEYSEKVAQEEEASRQASIRASIQASIQESVEESIRMEDATKPSSSGGSGGSSGSSSNPSNVRWLVPCDYGRVTSPFGYRWHPVTGEWSMHKGVDLSAPKGTPIYASRSGYVTAAKWGDTAGNYVSINHEDGYSSIYMHMTHYVVSAGDYVKAGQLIGYVGDTGRTKGAHLHFGISYMGEYVNPMDYIG